MLIAHEVHTKIIDTIKRRGPSLPIQIAKDISLSSLFVSAFLSELVDDKRVKVSSLKVGGSPLYFLEGQEEQLEKFYKFLHPKEAEAFLLLKSNKLLKEASQEPAIRVALRAIKDFSYGFKLGEDIYWRYLLVPEQEITDLINLQVKSQIVLEQKFEAKPEIKTEFVNVEVKDPEIMSEVVVIMPKIKENVELEFEKSKEIAENLKIIRKKIIKPKLEQKLEVKSEQSQFQNPFVSVVLEKSKKEKPKSEFVLDLIKFIEKNNWKIIEEKEYKAKEYFSIVQIDTELGPIAFLTLAKDKKSVNDTDLNTLLRQAQSLPLPALFIYTGNLSKKAFEYQQKYYSILKIKKIKFS